MQHEGKPNQGCPNPSATNPVSPGPGSRPHLHLQQLLLHQPLQCLLLLRFKVILAHVGQKLLSHDGVRNRATKTRVKTESQSDSCPFQSRLLISYAPEVRGTSEEAAREFQHLISRRHFAPPGIGSSRLFSSGPPSVSLTAVCARAVTPLLRGGTVGPPPFKRWDGELCQILLSLSSWWVSRFLLFAKTTY